MRQPVAFGPCYQVTSKLILVILHLLRKYSKVPRSFSILSSEIIYSIAGDVN